jgi:thiamine pyrophosphate-dependent acetolactate synthase large subunit-like protein
MRASTTHSKGQRKKSGPSSDRIDTDKLVGRRNFLVGAAAGGIATLATNIGVARAQVPGAVATKAAVPLPETDPVTPIRVLTVDRPGSDFMLDVLKSLGFEYVAANPGNTFRALHESIINYGGNNAPELITCCHEEQAVALGHGYYDVEGRPMLAIVHTSVGLQHASMGIYNAWAGRAPVYVLIGNTLDATVPHLMYHAAPDVQAMVRDFTKWDDTPMSLEHFAESAVRAYKVAMTHPRAPVVLAIDTELQERPARENGLLHIPKLTLDTPPQADTGSINEIARLLINSANPVIIAGRVARSQIGMDHFVEFAEALQAPIWDQGANLPIPHPLSQGAAGRSLIAQADVILGLEVENLWAAVNSERGPVYQNGTKLMSMSTRDLYARSNYQDLPRNPDVDLAVGADPEVTLPALTEAVKRLTTDERARMFQERRKRFTDASQKALERERANAVYGWNASPISRPRISAEVWAGIKGEDWATATGGSIDGGFVGPMWTVDKYYRRTNSVSANGVGFRAPSAVGAALAHKKHGRLFVYSQSDGDLMYAPSVLWTAAHHRIPMLAIMHNNRAYHQEVMEVQRMCAQHQRGIDRAGIGTKLEDPNLDFAKLAESMGWYAEGPISNPDDLGPAIKRAIAVVKRGEPALLDVVTQPR